jgi:hypothetical protein
MKMNEWNNWNNAGDEWNQNQTAGNNNPSPWDNFETVESSRDKNAYVPADLDESVKVIELKTIQSVKNNNRPVFIATVETAAGIRYDWVAKADERPYLQNIKALVMALNPEGDPRTFGRALMEALTGPEQPAAGMRVHLRSEPIVTRGGNDFTKVYWSPARD